MDLRQFQQQLARQQRELENAVRRTLPVKVGRLVFRIPIMSSNQNSERNMSRIFTCVADGIVSLATMSRPYPRSRPAIGHEKPRPY